MGSKPSQTTRSTSPSPSSPLPPPPPPPIVEKIKFPHNPIFEQIINEKFPEKREKYHLYKYQDPPQNGEGSKEVKDYYYLGKFEDGLFYDINGILIMIIQNPNQIEIYEGKFEKGKAKGYGKLQIYGNEHFLYKGGFEDNKQNDEEGLEQQQDFQYVGRFVNGKKQGKGEFEKKEQNRILYFKGLMENDQMDFGTLTILNLNRQSQLKYKGSFRNGQMCDANATIIDTNTNESYIGGITEGNFHGNGSYTNQNNQQIVGQWLHGAIQN